MSGAADVTRRGACPSLLVPMPTGDGLLARFVAPEGRLAPASLAALAETAARFGNGIVEVTRRGKLQARGLSEASAAGFAAAMAGLGVAPRPFEVEANALAALDAAAALDPLPVARAIEQAIPPALAARLAPKVSVVVDGGGAFGLGDLDADVRLAALGKGRLEVAVAGTAATAVRLGEIALEDAPRAVAALLALLAEKMDGEEQGRPRPSAARGRGPTAGRTADEAGPEHPADDAGPERPAGGSPSRPAAPGAGDGKMETPLPPPPAGEREAPSLPRRSLRMRDVLHALGIEALAAALGRHDPSPLAGRVAPSGIPEAVSRTSRACAAQIRDPAHGSREAAAASSPRPAGGERSERAALRVRGLDEEGRPRSDADPSPLAGRVAGRSPVGWAPPAGTTQGIPGGTAPTPPSPAGEGGSEPSGARSSSDLLGLVPLRAGVAVVVALPFGASDAAALAGLAERAEAAGVSEIFPLSGRRLALVVRDEQATRGLAGAARALGFILEADDPRRRIAACAGAPACASGHVAARRLAGEIAAEIAGRLGSGAGLVHVAGCAKGCAHPGRAALAVVGTAGGLALVVEGTARDAPRAVVAEGGLVDALAKLGAKDHTRAAADDATVT